MSDQVKFTQTPASALVEQGNASETEPVGQNTEAATQADLIRQAVEAALTDRDRRLQSDRDKLENRVNAQVNQVLQALEAAKIPLDENQKAVLTETVRSHATKPAAETEPGAPETETLNTLAAQLMADKGVELMDNDPEVATVDQSTRERFISTLTEALNAKKARLQKAGLPLGPGGPGKPSHIGKPPREVLDGIFSKYKGA